MQFYVMCTTAFYAKEIQILRFSVIFLFCDIQLFTCAYLHLYAPHKQNSDSPVGINKVFLSFLTTAAVTVTDPRGVEVREEGPGAAQ